jgi:hypothetical protein
VVTPEHASGAAEIFVATPADRAGAAADPGVRQPAVADFRTLSLRPDRHHLADILVAERDRQLHAAIFQAHPLAATEIEIAVGQMQVAVADAGCQNFEQHLTALRLRRGLLIKL